MNHGGSSAEKNKLLMYRQILANNIKIFLNLNLTLLTKATSNLAQK